MTKLARFYQYRVRGFGVRKSWHLAGLSLGKAISWVLIALGFGGMIYCIHRIAENRVEPHRKLAAENLEAFSQCMNGRPFVLDDGRVLLTEKAKEVRL